MKRSERYRTIYSVQRYGTDLDETVLTLDQETGWVTTAGSRQQADEGVAAEAIVEFLQTHDEPIDERSIHSNVEGRRATLQKAIRSLIETDQITRSGGGRRGDPYLYAVSGTLVPGI